MTELDVTDDADIPRLLTAALGLSAEAGEFTEVVKEDYPLNHTMKIMFSI